MHSQSINHEYAYTYTGLHSYIIDETHAASDCVFKKCNHEGGPYLLLVLRNAGAKSGFLNEREGANMLKNGLWLCMP